MIDLFRWRLNPAISERLYFYSTLCRLVYANDNTLWGQLQRGIPEIVSVRTFPVSNQYITSWAAIKGETGTLIVFEGTSNWWQLGNQAANYGQASSSFFPGRFSLHDSELALKMEPDVYNYIVSNAPANVSFVGHSLGGAVAQLMAHRIAQFLLPRIEGVITFGSKKVGDTTFATSHRWPVISVENIGDLVPLVTPPAHVYSLSADFGIQDPIVNLGSFASYEGAGVTYLVAQRGDIVILDDSGIRVGQFSAPAAPIPVPAYSAWVWQHQTGEYTRRLRSRLQHLTPVSQLGLIRTRSTLDALNEILNKREGTVWEWDPVSGLPYSSVINPNLPPPRCGCHRA